MEQHAVGQLEGLLLFAARELLSRCADAAGEVAGHGTYELSPRQAQAHGELSARVSLTRCPLAAIPRRSYPSHRSRMVFGSRRTTRASSCVCGIAMWRAAMTLATRSRREEPKSATFTSSL